MDKTLCRIAGFKMLRTEAAIGTVTLASIAITVDTIKHLRPHYFPADNSYPRGYIQPSANEESFHTRNIITTTLHAHPPTHQQLLIILLRISDMNFP